jgi:hypothetical protein
MFRKLALVLSLAATLATAQPAGDQPVEKTKKNIKVLTGLPTSQLIPVMAFMSNSLGVTCAHCHTDKWESDEKQAKDVARTMVLLQRDINERHFGGELAVTCNSCHQGRLRPQATPLLETAGWNQPPALPKPDLSKLPPADELVARYIKAAGGGKQATLDAKATATRMNGRTEPVSGPVAFHVGAEGLKIDTEFSYPPEANRGPGTAFLGPLRIKEMFKGMQVTGTDKVRGRDAYIVEAKAETGRPERLFFDKETGLLLRRYRETLTDFGVLPEQYDFDDYRDVAGVKVPFNITWSRADYKVTHKIESVTPAG